MVTDYEYACSHLRFVFNLKLAAWRQLPLSMIGMAHFSLDRAKIQMQHCLQQYDGAANPDSLHPIVGSVLAHGSMHRAVIEDIATGRYPSELPWPGHLRTLLGKWRFFYGM